MATKKKTPGNKPTKSKKKQKLEDLPAQEDPRGALDPQLLLRAAQPVLKSLAADLLARAKASPAVTAALKTRHAQERGAERTADPYDTWLRAFVEQVAAAWLLSCVFVRVLEDRGLVEQNRIAGPGALDSQQLFFELAPSLSERDYLLMVFRELSQLPAAKDLFDARHNPVWLLAPSAEGARELLALFRTPSPNVPALRFGQESTRFLGDLYQDLSEDVRMRYALWQTPDFVERFILDRTLERAIERFGLDETTLIDPTCGSGHFLLGAFDRLLEHRLRNEPGTDIRQAALKALDAISGADINPYAVAIARFRLTLAYLVKAGHDKLAGAPQLPLHLVVADSLLHNPQGKLVHTKGTTGTQMGLGEVDGVERKAFEGELYALEDEAAAQDVLHRRYSAVVGNPPYITPKDANRSKQYKGLYRTAVGAYHLSSPFLERFFQLAKQRGAVGLITDNAFMKRDYGKVLVEEFLPTVNLDQVVITSGAYLPGHGTPTVLLFGTAEPEEGVAVPVVLPKRGEPSTPAVPEEGKVWSSIAAHWNETGFENDYISVEDVDRSWLHKHPWVLAGGGAIDLFKHLNAHASARLGERVTAIGRTTHTGEDSFFFVPAGSWERLRVPEDGVVPLVKGEQVRDWSISDDEYSVFPYFPDASPRAPREGGERELFWRCRRTLKNRKDYGEFIEQRKLGGRPLNWFEHSMFFPERFAQPLGITFAFVATHNHFVLDRGGKVFNRTAPVIKLPANATEDDHLALLAYLNSSTACFWMKQVMQNRGAEENVAPALCDGVLTFSVSRAGTGSGGGYEFAATPLANLPVPSFDDDTCAALVQLAKQAERAASQRANAEASSQLSSEQASTMFERATAELIYCQEQIDWLVYKSFGLHALPITGTVATAYPFTRPFEIFLRKKHGPDSDAFDPDGRPILPFNLDDNGPLAGDWDERVRQIATSPQLRVIEDFPYKRRLHVHRQDDCAPGTDKNRVLEARRAAVVDRARAAELETRLRELGTTVNPCTRGADDDAARAIVAKDSVPFARALIYTARGLEKRDDWEGTWDLQRREDTGEYAGEIPVPPKYAQKDYRDATYWRLRGKLDVPKERFISYPGCESDEDGELLYGWAGWNHLQQARALAGLYEQRKREGWEPARLTPMLAGLLELLPWIKQWHNEPSDEYDGMRLGDYFQGYLDDQCATHGLSHEDLRAWRPPAKSRGKRKK